MEDAANPTQTSSSSAAAAAAAAAQHQQLQRQLFLMQQAQAQAQAQAQSQSQSQSQAQPHPQAQQLSQQAMSRFPSNIDAHLRPLGPHRFQQPSPSQLQTQPQPHSQGPSQSQSQPSPQQQQAAQARGRSPEVEMALQDAMRVCNPNIKTPFQSLEDAVSRLLPYHVVADYEAEEDDRILDSDATGQIPSRLQQWDHNILVKIAEFTTTFEKQVLAYNIMTKKRAIGEFRSEERLMLEQALLQEEKQATMELRAEIEMREKAGREAAEAKMRMAMAEHARVEAQAHSEMIGQGPLRANAAASQGDDHDMAQEQGEDGWENAQRDDDGEPSEDFLNDDNEPENGNSDMQEDWRRSGEFDLNSR